MSGTYTSILFVFNLIKARMIIYYPVSALMTLFTNVLQNPQDARTRSDIRLMHQVVSFLSSIAVEEETGGVKRMLEVCVEFERIAKVVVDKADKESHSRRKRKANHDDDDEDTPIANNHVPNPPQPSSINSGATPGPNLNNVAAAFSAPTPAADKAPTPQPTPHSHPTPTPSLNGYTPGPSFTSPQVDPTTTFTQPFSPTLNGFGSPTSGGLLPSSFPPPAPGDFPNMFTADHFPDYTQFGAANVGSPGMSHLQQFLNSGQDMWQMPMGEWEPWGGQGVGGFEGVNGVAGQEQGGEGGRGM